MKAKWLPALVVPGVMILGGTVAQPGAAAASNGVITSANWAGYAALANPDLLSFTYAQATLTVPALDCPPTAAGTANQLVFLGDTPGTSIDNDNSVGISETCKNGSPAYTALATSPCNGHNDELFTVNPGDTVKLVVTSTGVESADDLSTNQSGSNPLGTPCGDDSAAGVLTVGGFDGNGIADFTQAGFRQIQVQDNSQSTPQPLPSSAWTLAHYVLKGSSGKVDVKPEALLSGKFTSAFANDWLNAN